MNLFKNIEKKRKMRCFLLNVRHVAFLYIYTHQHNEFAKSKCNHVLTQDILQIKRKPSLPELVPDWPILNRAREYEEVDSSSFLNTYVYLHQLTFFPTKIIFLLHLSSNEPPNQSIKERNS